MADGDRYLTGTHALNISCPDGTPGDWHHSSLDWSDIPSLLVPVSSSPFGRAGLYRRDFPGAKGVLVANHVRACLDLVAEGFYGSAQGMRECFLDDPGTDSVVFGAVWDKLRNSAKWDGIDRFMGREYGCSWLDYKEDRNGHL